MPPPGKGIDDFAPGDDFVDSVKKKHRKFGFD
jgi:hypothetical protein